MDEMWKTQILIFMEIVRQYLTDDAVERGVDTVEHGPTRADCVAGVISILCDHEADIGEVLHKPEKEDRDVYSAKPGVTRIDLPGAWHAEWKSKP